MDINNICNELKNILSSPVKIVSDYEALPEVEVKISFPELGRIKTPALYYYRLGGECIEKISFENPCGWDYTPELCIYELRDVLLYNGFIFTKRGEFFADIPRRFSKDYSYARTFAVPLLLNDKYVLTQIRKDVSEIAYYDAPAINFCTYNMYGHHLLDSVTKLWISEYGYKPKLLLAPQHGRDAASIPKYLLSMTAPFNYSENDFILTQTGMFKKVYMVKHAFMLNAYMHNAAKRVHDKISAYYYSNTQKYPAKVFISRKGIKRRKLLNEDECEDLFRKHGFAVISPETLPFGEQVNMFANATHIAGPIGAGLHNIVFSRIPESVKLLFLTPPHDPLPQTYASIERSYNREAYAIIGDYVLEPGKPFDHFWNPWSIPLKEVEVGLKQWLAI